MADRLILDYVKESDTRLREQLAFLSEAQKEVLYAIHAEHGVARAITSGSFIRKHRLNSPSSVQAAVKKLLDYDMITRNADGYTISDPLLSLWLDAGGAQG